MKRLWVSLSSFHSFEMKCLVNKTFSIDQGGIVRHFHNFCLPVTGGLGICDGNIRCLTAVSTPIQDSIYSPPYFRCFNLQWSTKVPGTLSKNYRKMYSQHLHHCALYEPPPPTTMLYCFQKPILGRGEL